MLSRRGMLAALIGGGMGMALDPEKLLWVPGKKMISIPTPQMQKIYVYRYVVEHLATAYASNITVSKVVTETDYDRWYFDAVATPNQIGGWQLVDARPLSNGYYRLVEIREEIRDVRRIEKV